jgi:hypothetical protein
VADISKAFVQMPLSLQIKKKFRSLTNILLNIGFKRTQNEAKILSIFHVLARLADSGFSFGIGSHGKNGVCYGLLRGVS